MPYFLQRAQRKAAGAAIIFDPEVNSGNEQNHDTLRCPHCGGHFVPEPGSGRRRGWCFKCQALLCATAECNDTCDPIEAKLDRWEAEGPSFAELIERQEEADYLMARNLERLRG